MSSLATFRNIWQQPNLLRAIVNSWRLACWRRAGGDLLSVCRHRHAPQTGQRHALSDYSVLVPRAVPGLLAGLAFLWVFLFLPMWLDQSLKNGWLSALPVADWLREHLIVQLRALRNTIFSVWLAYTVVWMAYGLRLISRRCCRWRRSWRRPRAAPAHRAGRSPATSRFRCRATA
jgi:iron(III) transport system permease protein